MGGLRADPSCLHPDSHPDQFSVRELSQTKRAASCSVGNRPSGVSWSTTSGNCWLSPLSKSSRYIPENPANVLIRSAPSAVAKSFGEMDLLASEPIHDFATSPWPFCWNCLSRSFKPPLTTLPAAPPPSNPPSPPLSKSSSPPPVASGLCLSVLLPALACLPVKALMAW